MPWGISESGYNADRAHMNYQYRAFGVPGLGFKRGLGDDLVIAPYASAIALTVAPRRGVPQSAERWLPSGFQGATVSTKRSTTRRRACRRADHAIVRLSWPTTRG